MKLLVSLITIILLSNTNVNENIFFGKWTLCNIECEEQTSYFNVCTEIIFEEENKGLLILPQNKIDFNYYLEKEEKIIKFNFKEKQNQFEQEKYEYTFNESNEFILQTKDSCIYIFNKLTV